MEKFLGLLHEGTIVDLKMVSLLIKRYKLHLAVAVIFFAAFFSHNYYSQPTIYAVSVPVKTIPTQKVSSDLSALLPVDNTNHVTLDEFNISITSYTFIKSLAEMLILEPSFLSMDFGSLKSRDSVLGSQIKKSCKNNKDCMQDLVISYLKGMFYVEQGMTENRFILTANAIEVKTAKTLASTLAKAVELDRVRLRQYTVQKEIKNVSHLISESRSMMQSMGGYAALEEQEKLQNNIADLKERIRMLQYNSSVEMANGTSLQAKLVENKKTTKGESATPEQFELYIKTQARLKDIKLNISNLTLTDEYKRSASDKLIVAQLQAEQARLLKLIPSLHHLKSLELNENFKDKQRENLGNFEFEYLVSKNKIQKLKEDYDASTIELNSLLQKKLTNENKVNGMKSDLDFLKNLEAKLMSLKLLNATMTSDLIFEGDNQQAIEFRNSSVLRIFLFSFSITAFLYLVSVLTRYSADDKIYSEQEIRMYLKELDFVGDVPSFE